METTNKKWYQQTGWVIALCIFIFPVGLYLLWKNPFMSKTLKWIVFGCWLALFGYSASNTEYKKSERNSGGGGGAGSDDDNCCCTYLDNDGKPKHKTMKVDRCIQLSGKWEKGSCE